MSARISELTKENLELYLKELGKEFRKLNGVKMPAEIIIVGGASILLNYGFRNNTYDVDAIVSASSAMKGAVNRVADKHDLSGGWFNTHFLKTDSYTDKLVQYSKYYRTFSNVLTVRTVTGEYLIAMKLMSGRKYKYDLSDIIGILKEHNAIGNPIAKAEIKMAVENLYGEWESLPVDSIEFLEMVYDYQDYENLFDATKSDEANEKEEMIKTLKSTGHVKEDNVAYILEIARSKKE